VREIIEFLTRHGYIVLGVAVLLEQLGVPIPSMPVLLAAGAISGLGTLNPVACIAIALVAAVVGDLFWFLLGRRYGSAVLGILCRISLEPDSCVEHTERVYSNYGVWTLVFAKFVPGLSTVMTPLAGRFRLAPWRFLLFDGLGALLWTTTYIATGWLFRTELEHLADSLFRMGKGFAVIVVVLLAIYVGYRYYRRRLLYRELRMSRIAPWELKERIERGDDLLLIDLRNPVERDQGIIPGSTLLSVAELATLSSELLEKSEVVLYCS
jgi:membrane protein DedA with SNARE-associated domain